MAGPRLPTLLLLLLAPTSPLQLGDPGGAPRASNPGPGPPPIAHLRMDPAGKRLTWDLLANVSAVWCFEDEGFRTRAKNNRFCTFPVLPRCKPSTYTVRGALPGGETFASGLRHPRPEGDPEAAARNLSCEVHDLDFLTCTWAAGKAAPSDVQYDFYVEDTGSSQQWPCPRYTANARGTRVQCQFNNVSAFPRRRPFGVTQHRFLVTGAARGGPVPCAEEILSLSKIERLIAPSLNATCNASLALLEWEMSSHFHRWFEYDLEIQQGADPPYLQTVQGDQSFPLTNPRAFWARIRARYPPELVGGWSARRRFVCAQEADPGRQARLTSGLIALGALISVGAAVFLCRRFSVLRTLFPPIPRLKDPIGGGLENEKMFPWGSGAPPQEECPVADVQILRDP